MSPQRRRGCLRLKLAALAAAISFTCVLRANAEETDAAQPWLSPPGDWSVRQWTLHKSLYTKHWNPVPEHNNHQNLIGVELGFDRNWVAGAALLDNSFNQPSQLLFVGKYWPLFGSEHFYGKVMAGLLHGYKEPYEDKIPLNQLGVAPVIIPSLGFSYRMLVLEGAFGGLAALKVTVGVRF
jgi:hypothetical protein